MILTGDGQAVTPVIPAKVVIVRINTVPRQRTRSVCWSAHQTVSESRTQPTGQYRPGKRCVLYCSRKQLRYVSTCQQHRYRRRRCETAKRQSRGRDYRGGCWIVAWAAVQSVSQGRNHEIAAIDPLPWC